MIQRVIFIGLLSAFIGGAAISKALDCSEKVSDVQQENQKRILTKAIAFDGEIIPRVDLPEVAVNGERSAAYWVDATIVDGHAYPSYLLTTVTVKAAK